MPECIINYKAITEKIDKLEQLGVPSKALYEVRQWVSREKTKHIPKNKDF